MKITNFPPGRKTRTGCPGTTVAPQAANFGFSPPRRYGTLFHRMRSFVWTTENRLRASVVSVIGEGTESLSAAVLRRWFCVWSNHTPRAFVWIRGDPCMSDRCHIVSAKVKIERRRDVRLAIPRQMTSIVSIFRRIDKKISRGTGVRAAICEKLELSEAVGLVGEGLVDGRVGYSSRATARLTSG